MDHNGIDNRLYIKIISIIVLLIWSLAQFGFLKLTVAFSTFKCFKYIILWNILSKHNLILINQRLLHKLKLPRLYYYITFICQMKVT